MKRRKKTMAINFGVALGAAGKTFGDHLLEMRKAREARKATFENQKELLGIQNGYATQLKLLDIQGELEKELIKQGNKRLGGVNLNPIPGYSDEKFSYQSSAPDARARQDEYFNATLRHLDPFLTAINDGTLSVDEATKMLKDTGNYNQLVTIATNKFNLHLKDRGENRAPGSATDIFGPAAALFAPFVYTNVGGDPRVGRYGQQFSNTIAHVLSNGSTPAGANENIAYDLFYNNNEFKSLLTKYENRSITSTDFIEGTKALLGRTDLSDTQIIDIIGTATSATGDRNRIDRAGIITPVQFPKVDTGANLEQQLRTAENLSDATYNIAKTLLTQEPIVTDIASGAVGIFSNLVTGGKELMSVLGLEGKTAKQAFSDGQHVTIAGQIEKELSSTGLSSSQQREIMEGIRSSEKTIAGLDISNEQNLATYQYHMQKLSLAYAYSKFIQGGAGGNAVSNADFQNTTNALFRTYDTSPENARKTLATGMLRLHNSIQNFVVSKDLERKYSFSKDGKTYLYADGVTKNLYEDILTEQNNLAQTNDPMQYWMAIAERRRDSFVPLATTAAASDEQSVPPPAPVRQGRRTTDQSSRIPSPD
jgi:hypothetical protein